jgi:hypothetical protein
VIAEELERAAAEVATARDAQHLAEREREQALSDLRVGKQREAELSARLETVEAERDQLKAALGKARELEAKMFSAEQAGAVDRKHAGELERELGVSRETLRLTSGELDSVRQSEQELRSQLVERDAELAAAREQLASTSVLVEAWKRRAEADKTIAKEARALKLEAAVDGGSSGSGSG